MSRRLAWNWTPNPPASYCWVEGFKHAQPPPFTQCTSIITNYAQQCAQTTCTTINWPAGSKWPSQRHANPDSHRHPRDWPNGQIIMKPLNQLILLQRHPHIHIHHCCSCKTWEMSQPRCPSIELVYLKWILSCCKENKVIKFTWRWMKLEHLL